MEATEEPAPKGGCPIWSQWPFFSALAAGQRRTFLGFTWEDQFGWLQELTIIVHIHKIYIYIHMRIYTIYT